MTQNELSCYVNYLLPSEVVTVVIIQNMGNMRTTQTDVLLTELFKNVVTYKEFLIFNHCVKYYRKLGQKFYKIKFYMLLMIPA